ncbi:hypothetical protein K1719_012776 [Acacia pycnantha]|nr:hypothetical protein K1719_012776 [Acacia pycnantha]
MRRLMISRKSIPMATALYKLVAERGPWSSLSRWALESYFKGDVGKVFMLYSRMTEMGYEVAQSNAAWILDKYAESRCALVNLDFVQMQKGINVHILCGGRPLNKLGLDLDSKQTLRERYHHKTRSLNAVVEVTAGLGSEDESWWNRLVRDMGLEEVQEFKERLQQLRYNLVAEVEEKKKEKMTTTTVVEK